MPAPVSVLFHKSVCLLLCATVLIALSGCREKLPYNVGGTGLPDLADKPAKIALPQPGPQGMTDSVTFEGAKPPLYEEYVEWLTKKGWSRLSETQQVTSLHSIYVKDNRLLNLYYSPSNGLTITGTRPADPTSASAGDSTPSQ